MKYKATEMVMLSSNQVETENGWYPARPETTKGLHGLKQRIKHAYKVLIGKYDVIDWE